MASILADALVGPQGMTGPHAVGGAASRAASALDGAAKVLTIVGLLLPASGAIYRETAFALHGGIPLGVGVDLPLSTLAVMGARALQPSIPVVLASLVLTVIAALIAGRLRGRITPTVVRRIPPWMVLALVVLLLIPLVYITVATSNVIVDLIALVDAVVVYALVLPAAAGRIRFREVVGVVVVAVALSSLGLAARPASFAANLAAVTFAANGPLPNGVYSVLGDDGSTSWLLACGSGAAARVPDASIAIETYVTPEPVPTMPSVLDQFHQGIGPLGYSQGCPSP